MTWTLILSVLLTFGLGYVGRWIQDSRYRQSEKLRIEAEYRNRVREAVHKAIAKYEDEQEILESMSRSERVRYIADNIE